MTAVEVEYTEWLGKYPVHLEASKYPMMDDDRLQDLAEDIAENGQREPIVLAYEELGQKGRLIIIDGRNRFAACELAEVEPEFVTKSDIEPDEIGSWIEAHNRYRRHLTPDQYKQLSTAEKREVIAASLKADPAKSDRQHAKTVGASPSTAGKVRRELVEAGELSNVDSRESADGKTRPVKPAEPVKRKRRPLTEAFPDALEKLRRASVALKNITDDDRMPRNREALSAHLPDFERIQDGLDDVHKALSCGASELSIISLEEKPKPLAVEYQEAIEAWAVATRKVVELQSQPDFAALRPYVGGKPGRVVSEVSMALPKVRQGLSARKKGKK